MKKNTQQTTTVAGIIVLAVTISLFIGVFSPVNAVAADNGKYPILLIHGLASNTMSWKNFPKYLNNKGFDVFVMDFNEWADLPYANRDTKDLRHLSAVLAREISMIKQVTGKSKVNIVAHSIGGLIVRAYMAGYGAKIENRGRYGGDINRVVYLSTPFFGIAKSGSKYKQLYKDTDYGPFLDANTLYNITRNISEELIELADWHIENGAKLGVEELTVYSERDNVVDNYSANLDGLKYNPFRILRPYELDNVENESHHVTIKQFNHAEHNNIGNSKKTILGVGAKNHAVLTITTNWFSGTDGWKKEKYNIRNDNKTLTILRVAKSSGIDLSSFKPGSLFLTKVTTQSRKRMKLVWHNSAEFYHFEKGKTGTYELSYPPAGNYAIKFDLNIMNGMTQLATFDPNNLPFDPAYEQEDGDQYIKPGDIPAALTDYKSLRRFVLAAFPFESRVYKPGNQMITLVKQVRDAMLKTYPNLQTRNDYDKFGLSELETVDWAKDWKGDGVLANKLTWLLTVIEPEEPDDGGGGGGGGIPDDVVIPKTEPTIVNSKKTLKEFALYHFGARMFDYLTPNVKGLAHLIRDKVVARFDEYFLPWSNSSTGHFDAFANRYDVTTIDFVVGSSSPGVLYYKLTWGVHHDPIWAK